jgi:hypothetical protein
MYMLFMNSKEVVATYIFDFFAPRKQWLGTVYF